MPEAAVIVSTYNQPEWLDLCLLALREQSMGDFEVLIADDGSDERTARVIERHQSGFRHSLRHVWQEDAGFRKTRILNRAALASESRYLIFTDGDCLAQPDFVKTHVEAAEEGTYLNGSLIRLNERLSKRISPEAVSSGKVFRSWWLIRAGRRCDRRFLRLSLPPSLRSWLDRHSPTRLYWLGSNSSCFRKDLVAVNGFDNRFTYGFEDGDFGNRLEHYGLKAKTVRWTANVLHLWHGRPWSSPDVLTRNRALMDENRAQGGFRAPDGMVQLDRKSERATRAPADKS